MLAFLVNFFAFVLYFCSYRITDYGNSSNGINNSHVSFQTKPDYIFFIVLFLINTSKSKQMCFVVAILLLTIGIVSSLHENTWSFASAVSPGGMIDCPDGQVSSIFDLYRFKPSASLR